MIPFICFLCGIIVATAGCGVAILLSDKRNMIKPARSPSDSADEEILVKRVRPSYRNPSKTSRTAYEPYRTKSGLYAAIKPGKGSTADEREVRE